jgi:hypothetical protein
MYAMVDLNGPAAVYGVGHTPAEARRHAEREVGMLDTRDLDMLPCSVDAAEWVLDNGGAPHRRLIVSLPHGVTLAPEVHRARDISRQE